LLGRPVLSVVVIVQYCRFIAVIVAPPARGLHFTTLAGDITLPGFNDDFAARHAP
jgi:hypothetical protein